MKMKEKEGKRDEIGKKETRSNVNFIITFNYLEL